MQLHGFFGGKAERIEAGNPRRRRRLRQFGALGVDHRDAVQRMGAGDFDLDIHVGALVFDALIAADGLAKGDTRLGIFDRQRHCRGSGADGFISQDDRGAIEPGLIVRRIAERFGGNAVQRQAAVAADEIERFDGFDLGGLQIDDPQRRAISTGGGDNRQVRAGQIGNRCLDAVQLAAAGSNRHRGGCYRAGFVPGRHGDDAAIGDAGKIFCLLGFAAGDEQRFGGEQRCDQRHHRQRAAGGFGKLAAFFGAHAQPAMRFGHARRCPAKASDFRPKRRIEIGGILGHCLASRCGAGLVGKQLFRLFAKCLGIVRKIEIHVSDSPIMFGGPYLNVNPVQPRVSGGAMRCAAR